MATIRKAQGRTNDVVSAVAPLGQPHRRETFSGLTEKQAQAATAPGATREKILETLGIAIYMGAEPSATHGHALGAHARFATAKSAEPTRTEA